MTPRVLIADKLSAAAIEIFGQRGVDADVALKVAGARACEAAAS